MHRTHYSIHSFPFNEIKHTRISPTQDRARTGSRKTSQRRRRGRPKQQTKSLGQRRYAPPAPPHRWGGCIPTADDANAPRVGHKRQPRGAHNHGAQNAAVSSPSSSAADTCTLPSCRRLFCGLSNHLRSGGEQRPPRRRCEWLTTAGRQRRGGSGSGSGSGGTRGSNGGTPRVNRGWRQGRGGADSPGGQPKRARTTPTWSRRRTPSPLSCLPPPPPEAVSRLSHRRRCRHGGVEVPPCCIPRTHDAASQPAPPGDGYTRQHCCGNSGALLGIIVAQARGRRGPSRKGGGGGHDRRVEGDKAGSRTGPDVEWELRGPLRRHSRVPSGPTLTRHTSRRTAGRVRNAAGCPCWTNGNARTRG